MKKTLAVKSVLSVGVIALLAATASPTGISAATFCTETSLAGITVSLDQYTKIAEASNKIAEETAKEEIVTEEIEITAEETNAEEAAVLAKAVEAEPVEEVSEYENVGVSVANNYVNIRQEPNTESEVLGKLYRGSAATLLEKEGEWVKIKSGRVTGYINAEYLAIGFDVEELIDTYATKWAVVNTTTLKVREEASTEAITLTLIPLGEHYEVLKEENGWVQILLDEGDGEENQTTGWVSGDFVDIKVEFEEAISIEEEQEELRREEEARLAEEERLRQLEAERRAQQQAAANANKNNSSSSSSSNTNKGSSTSSSAGSSSSSSNSGSSSSSNSSSAESSGTVASGDGAAIAAYAQKFVGNPYVYGGTSLTNGADCSGFVQSVYAHFGIRIPRTSRDQAVSAGKKVDLGSLQPGDLIFYTSGGRVNHVAMYIGGGRVVHASNRKEGIKTSAYNYRTPYCARRIVQ